MTIHNVAQGSHEWHALRAKHYTASEAPAMMGCSPYETRGALLRRKATGLTAEVDAATQRRFDAGHAAEAALRPVAEGVIGDELYPATITAEVEGLPLLASMDGLTMDGTIGFEHKLYNAETARIIDETGEPPIHHVWQLEHQMAVSGAEKILFVTSDGTTAKAVSCWYESKPERRKALIEGWKQFAADLAAYVPEAPATPAPPGRAPESLPALRIEVTGAVTASNLAEFKAHALAVFRSINRDLRTDEDFADAERTVKWCADVEARLKAAKDAALAQTADIEALFRAIDDIAAEARSTRLELDKLVKARKEQIKAEIVAAGQTELYAHLRKLQERIGMALPTALVPTDFIGAIKGLRSVDSIKDAVHQEVTRAKLAANEIADRMELNIKSLIGEAHDWSFLFPDLASVAHKPAEDFANLLAARIAAHKQAEEQRRAREAEAAAKAAQVVQQAAATVAVQPAASPVRDSGATLKLREINERLAPIQITAAGLSDLGFQPAGKEGASVLYRASDLPAICAALIDVLRIAAGGAVHA